jgi:hypothetical protein
MDSHNVPPEELPRSRPSNDTSDDTVTDTADEGQDVTEKTLGYKPQEDNAITAVTTNEPQYLEGLQLVLVVACVTLVCFLVLLDTSIIATVRDIMNTVIDDLANITVALGNS